MPWTYAISDLKGEEIVETFYERELQNTNQKEFRLGKAIKRKRREDSYMPNSTGPVV